MASHERTPKKIRDLLPREQLRAALTTIRAGGERRRNQILAGEVVSALTAKGLYITTVESCTGGALADTITNIPGASGIMKDSAITYSTEAKEALGVPRDIIDSHTVYSIETAEAMARAGLERSVRADIAVGITGSMSRPDPSNPNSRPGEVFIAVVDRNGSTELRTLDGIDRKMRYKVKQRIVNEALEAVLEFVSKT